MNKAEYYERVSSKYHMIKNKRNFIIIGSPNHGNIGDIAITFSTIKLLEQLYPNDNIFDITMDEFPYEIDAVFHLINPQDVIILQGGGNLGNMYLDDEMIRRYVISRFKNNRIIMFPQSVYYSNDLAGENELRICAKLYSQNKNLVMLARDKHSFEIVKREFHVPSEQISDIVLTQKIGGDTPRESVLLCFRDDKEGTLTDQDKRTIMDIISSFYSKIKRTDTAVEFDGNKSERDKKLTEKLKEFQKAELVITDRLHGLIFSVITNTPCIVFPTINNKITSAFEDLHQVEGIYLMKSVETIQEVLIKEVKVLSNINYDNTWIVKQYKDILDRVLNCQPICEQDRENTDNIFLISAYWDYKAYESEYWRNNIKKEYDKLQSNNEERIKELSDYKQWNDNLQAANMELQESYKAAEKSYEDRNTEIKEYKEWVGNLEKQKEEMTSEYQKVITQLETIDNAYKNQNKNLEDRLKELEEYKNWVSNLETQRDELKLQFQEISDQYQSLEKKYESQKIESYELSKNLSESKEQLTISLNEIEKMKAMEIDRERQINIQLVELYNNVKRERDEKFKAVAELNEKTRSFENEKTDLSAQLDAVKLEFENERKNRRGIVSKTLRCLKLYGMKHTIRECMETLKGNRR